MKDQTSSVRSLHALGRQKNQEAAPKPRPLTLAQLFALDESRRLAAFSAVSAVLEVSVDPARRKDLLAFGARTLDLDAPDESSLPPTELAAIFTDEQERLGMAHALVIAACLGPEVTAEGEARVNAYADAMGVRSRWVRLLGPLRRRATFAVKRALIRSSPDARRLFTRTWQEEGVRGFGRALLFVLGVARDEALAKRFRALEQLPSDSFGAHFFHHVRSRGLTFPGEKGGMPERMVHHDLMHVLNGYDTDGAGECELAGFYAASSGGDAFTFIVIALAAFQLGLAVSPAAVTPTVGAFDPERVANAYLRGRSLQVDIMGPWDYWQLMPLSREEAARRIGISLSPRAGLPSPPLRSRRVTS
jgi:hypothetical protein